MIRFVTRTLFSLIAVAAVSGTAQAAFVPATWTDDYITDQVVSPGSPAEYFHDITFDGFKPGSDLVTSFLLTIDLYSNSASRWFQGIAVVDAGFGTTNPLVFSFGDSAYKGISLLGLFSLNLEGLLDVSVSSLIGEFELTGSHLVAKGYQSVASVPEPGTLALLGLGLLGIAAGVRRKATRN